MNRLSNSCGIFTSHQQISTKNCVFIIDHSILPLVKTQWLFIKIKFSRVFLSTVLLNNQMSEIDFKAPFLCQQLALSEKESLTGHQIDKQIDTGDDCFDICVKNINNNMYRSVQSGSHLSQTTTSKRSSPIKINTSLIRSSFNPLGRSTDFNQNRDIKANFPVLLQSIGEQEQFECQHDNLTDKTCQICKGTGFVKGNSNLIKFFEYLIGFKLGINSSYKQKKIMGGNKKEVNNFCNDFYSKNDVRSSNIRTTAGNFTYRINTRASEKPAPSIRSSMNNEVRTSGRQTLNQSERFSNKTARICSKDDVVQELNSLVTVHENYKCDICDCSPIIGLRYHCHDCEDFDSCQSCYNKCLHPHMMQKIEKNGKGKQLEHLINFLAQPTCKNTRQSLRPPPSITMGNGSIKTTRSAIR